MVNQNSYGFAIWKYLSSLYLVANHYPFCLFFVVKITLFNGV